MVNTSYQSLFELLPEELVFMILLYVYKSNNKNICLAIPYLKRFVEDPINNSKRKYSLVRSRWPPPNPGDALRFFLLRMTRWAESQVVLEQEREEMMNAQFSQNVIQMIPLCVRRHRIEITDLSQIQVTIKNKKEKKKKKKLTKPYKLQRKQERIYRNKNQKSFVRR